MAKYSPNDIPNKHADWGIDTTDLQQRPFSGGAVQNFLKQMLESKSGYFYKDTENNRILIFADEENKNTYLQNPEEHSDLLIQSIDTTASNIKYIKNEEDDPIENAPDEFLDSLKVGDIIITDWGNDYYEIAFVVWGDSYIVEEDYDVDLDIVSFYSQLQYTEWYFAKDLDNNTWNLEHIDNSDSFWGLIKFSSLLNYYDYFYKGIFSLSKLHKGDDAVRNGVLTLIESVNDNGRIEFSYITPCLSKIFRRHYVLNTVGNNYKLSTLNLIINSYNFGYLFKDVYRTSDYIGDIHQFDISNIPFKITFKAGPNFTINIKLHENENNLTNILYHSDYRIEENKIYELTVVYNGVNFVISAVELVTTPPV